MKRHYGKSERSAKERAAEVERSDRIRLKLDDGRIVVGRIKVAPNDYGVKGDRKNYRVKIGWVDEFRYVIYGFSDLAGGGVAAYGRCDLPSASEAVARSWRRVGDNMRKATKKVKSEDGGRGSKDTKPRRWLTPS